MPTEKDRVYALIDELVTLPTLPTVVAEINSLVANENSSAADVARVIQTDVAIATKVLRLANSAYYGLRSKVNSVQHAVAMLGFNIIKNLALTATVFQDFQDQGGHDLFDHERFWKHCVATGMVARLLAQRMGLSRKDVEVYFVAGLLHDVGKIILEQHVHDRFIEALELSAAERIPLHRAEENVLGFTHADVGAMLADRWHLAPEIIAAAEHHHAPMAAAGDTQIVQCTVHVADLIARLRPVGHGGGAVHPRFQEDAWQFLGLGTEVLEPLIRQLDEAVENDSMLAAS